MHCSSREFGFCCLYTRSSGSIPIRKLEPRGRHGMSSFTFLVDLFHQTRRLSSGSTWYSKTHSFYQLFIVHLPHAKFCTRPWGIWGWANRNGPCPHETCSFGARGACDQRNVLRRCMKSECRPTRGRIGGGEMGKCFQMWKSHIQRGSMGELTNPSVGEVENNRNSPAGGSEPDTHLFGNNVSLSRQRALRYPET